MKKFLLALVLGATLLGPTGCSKEDSPDVDPKCGLYNGKQLYNGPKGGCYYINANNNKEYVTRSYCNC